MADIFENLNRLREKSGGELKTLSTITLKSDTLNISVSGESIESAYRNLMSIITPEEVKKEVPAEKPVQNKQEDTKQQIQNVLATKPAIQVGNGGTAQQTPFQVPANVIPSNNGSKELSDALNGRRLVRIYNNAGPLVVGESLLTFGGLTYVVADN